MENTEKGSDSIQLVSEWTARLGKEPRFPPTLHLLPIMLHNSFAQKKEAQATRLTFFKQQPVITAPNSQLQENSGKGSQGLHWFKSSLKSDEEKTCTTLSLGNILWGGRLEGSLTSPSSFESSCPQERKSSYLAKGMTGSGSSRR